MPATHRTIIAGMARSYAKTSIGNHGSNAVFQVNRWLPT
jgi:hypothetical protein